MKYDNDVLSVTFCKDDNGDPGLAVFKELKYNNGDTKNYMIKMVMGEQAEILYRLLTDQEETVDEIKMKSNNQDFKKNIIISHTCGRCKHEQLPEDVYPCDRCMYGPDDRYDFWEEKEDE